MPILCTEGPSVEVYLQSRTGVQFQDGALFSSLIVTENIVVPIREHVGLEEPVMRDIAALKIAMVGLPPDTGEKKPSELSGGEQQREMSIRFGINLVIYAMTGNYKTDVVHAPALLQRLGTER